MITFIMLGTLILQVFGMEMRSKPAQACRLFDAAALTEPPFVLYSGF